MRAIGQQDAVNILRFFDDLPDPRSKVNQLHRLGDVIVIAICAIIATANGPTAIAKWWDPIRSDGASACRTRET